MSATIVDRAPTIASTPTGPRWRRLLGRSLLLAVALVFGAAPAAAQAAPITKLLVIAFENHTRGEVIGQSGRAPYITSLAQNYGQAIDYVNLTHPSLPNYLAVTGGSTFGITSDCAPTDTGCSTTSSSIFSQMVNNGGWHSYHESMETNCELTDSADNLYVVHHNPAAYYTTLATCATNDTYLYTPYPQFGANFNWLSPNGCYNMHVHSGCPGSTDEVTRGDDWLKGWLPGVLTGSAYGMGNMAIVLWWDENDGTTGKLPFVVISPNTAGVSYSGAINHYDALFTFQKILGKACLANSCGQTNFRAAFGL